MQLELDDAEVLERVGRAGHVVVGEGPQHEDDGVDLADVAEEAVAEALALAGPLDQPADVDELHGGRHDVLALAHLGQRVEAVVGHLGHARRWGRWWRRRRARRARRRRRARCTATTCRRWGGRRTRSVPSAEPRRPATAACEPRPVGASAAMAPVEALDRVVYLLDRALAESRRVPGLRATPRDLVRELGDDEIAQRHADGTLTDLPGIGPSTGEGHHPGRSTAGSTTYLAELEAETAIPIGEGAELRAALKGDCHSHSPGATAARRSRTMARAAMALGHEYMVLTDHSPRLTIAHGLNRERLLAAARRDRPRSTSELAPFRILTGMEVDILEDGALDQDEDLLERLDVVVASVHSKLRMPSAGDDPAHGDGRRQPPRRHPRPLHRPQGRRHAAGRRATFDAEHRVRRLRPVRHRGRDQLPARAPGPARRAARSWPSSGTARSRIDTDAHAPGQLEWQPYGCDKAARHGIEPERIVNTMAADDLVAWAGLAPHADA